VSGDWTDLWPTDRLRRIRKVHAAEAEGARQMLGHDEYDPVLAASVAEVAELRVWQADVALRRRRA
jgi:hypothetical protein